MLALVNLWWLTRLWTRWLRQSAATVNAVEVWTEFLLSEYNSGLATRDLSHNDVTNVSQCIYLLILQKDSLYEVPLWCEGHSRSVDYHSSTSILTSKLLLWYLIAVTLRVCGMRSRYLHCRFGTNWTVTIIFIIYTCIPLGICKKARPFCGEPERAPH